MRDCGLCDVGSNDARVGQSGVVEGREVETAKGAELILHSDRGSQYCSQGYRALVAQFGLRVSMSRRGDCYDNAPMESFWGSLKHELVHHRRYRTRTEAEASIRVLAARSADRGGFLNPASPNGAN
ncbi:hypothetical protein CSQ89_18555 [Chitinimonas sp. BJB300]|nr:hypothetical protein CSQ89_18555 [Chitinimonas sp. BJB300]TSJ83844.1 DDE-type integrase/transposase/recombinase [Chitinimonas sp. BJB300]